MWREGYVPGGETRFWVRARGHGDDVVMLLHGWPEDGGMWDRVADVLVDAGWRVVAPDLKGFGRSAGPRRGYDPQTLADEIAQLIRNLHARRAVVVGHDWGGAVALATAFRHPGHVRALVLADAPYRELDLRSAWHIPLMNIPVLPELLFRYAAGPLVRGAIRYSAQKDDAFSPETLQRYSESVSAQPSRWLAYYRTLSRRAVVDWVLRNARKRLPGLRAPSQPPRLRMPALVVWGEDDPVTPAHLAPRIAQDLGAELVLVPGAGHFVPEEDPGAFAAAVLDLIGPGGGGAVRTAEAAGA